MTEHVIETAEQLRSSYGEPSERAARKSLDRLDRHCRRFIELSPFVVLASAGADGRVDCSPRGDPAGFVAVLDDRTVLLPDRLGNNRVDSLRNVLESPYVGLLFMIPGVDETLRLNGRAELTTDPALLEPLAVKGRSPRSGLVVSWSRWRRSSCSAPRRWCAPGCGRTSRGWIARRCCLRSDRCSPIMSAFPIRRGRPTAGGYATPPVQVSRGRIVIERPPTESPPPFRPAMRASAPSGAPCCRHVSNYLSFTIS